LSELEKIIDRALFIDKGELVFSMEHKKENIYHITVSDAPKAVGLLEGKELAATCQSENVTVFSGTENVSNVMAILHDNGINVLDVERKESDLEGIFYELFVEG
jgi:ABC-type multidrug transport system ATPase subunit